MIKTKRINYQDGKIKTGYNTDNMGKLLVTLFAFAPAPKTAL